MNLTELPKRAQCWILSLTRPRRLEEIPVVLGKHPDGLNITVKFSDKQGRFGYLLAKITKKWKKKLCSLPRGDL